MSANSKSLSKKDRSANFSAGEQRVLAAEVARRGKIINGEFSATLTHAHKIVAWEQVTECVNAVGTTTRTVENIKIKWKHMKMATKRKCAHNKREISKTGGGCADLKILSATEEVVSSQIGKSSLQGLGGLDTMQGMFTQDEVIFEGDIDVMSQPGPSKPVHPQPPLTDDDKVDEPMEPMERIEPPKKRVRSRRTKEDLHNKVVSNQEDLNKKIGELIELKKKKMQAQALQHAEAMEIQREIAAMLGKIFDSRK